MTAIQLDRASPDDLRELGRFVRDRCRPPEHHCLHSWSGETVEDLAAGWARGLAADEQVLWLARRDGSLVGAAGAEYDRELGRAWLMGPHASDADWEALSPPLFARTLDALPPGIRQFDVYVNAENARARRFYLERGFRDRVATAFVYVLDFERAKQALEGQAVRAGELRRPGELRSPGELRPPGEADRATFLELFPRLFPGATYPPERLLAMDGESRWVRVLVREGRVDGFVICHVNETGSVGDVEYLGVRPEAQRRGLGRRLLLAGVRWLRDEAKTPEIGLNVREELGGARKLYESVGFEMRYAGVALRRMRESRES